jgi:LPXTG-motif cell wall-anchored protein
MMIAVLASAIITAQTTYACFCIRGIMWESQCNTLFPQQPTPPAQNPTTPTTPEEPSTPVPTTPVDTPTSPSTPETPVVTASVTTPAPAPQPTVAELPHTGASDTFIVTLAGLGLLTYAGIYAARFIKR